MGASCFVHVKRSSSSAQSNECQLRMARQEELHTLDHIIGPHAWSAALCDGMRLRTWRNYVMHHTVATLY